MKKEWKVIGYDNKKGCDILGYYENGALHCSFDGYRRDKQGLWVVYPRRREYASWFPSVKKVYYSSAVRDMGA